MPKIDRDRMRDWLENHNWTIGRLTEECNALGGDTLSPETMRNVVNGIDPLRPGRIRLICRVTSKYGDGISYKQLIAKDTTSSSDQQASTRPRTINQLLATVDPLPGREPEHHELLARHIEVIRTLAGSSQPIAGTIDHHDDRTPAAWTPRNVGHELVTLAGALITLGIDLVNQENDLSGPA